MVASGTKPRTIKVRRNSAKTEPIEELKSGSASDLNMQAYVPSPEIAQKYVARKIHGVWDFDVAVDAARHNENILLMGDTGAGKTMFGESVASKLRKMYYSIPCDVSIDPSAFFGRMVPNDEGGISWQDGPMTQIARGTCGRGGDCNDPKCNGAGVLNISEINFMPPKIAASTYPLLDHRRYIPLLAHKGEVVTLHPRTLIICDMNPNYRGTMELNAAFLNRFAHKIEWNYNTEVEEKLLTLPSTRALAQKLRALKGTEIMTPVSTNMLMEFESFAMRDVFGLDYAIENLSAAFAISERQAVKNAASLNKSSWQSEIKFLRKGTSDEEKEGSAAVDPDDDELEEIEFDFEDEK